MTGEHVLSFIQHLLSLSANEYTRSSTTSYARTFLRFLRWSDLNSQDLARFVLRTPCWRLAHLPPRLAWEDVGRAIDAIDTTTPSGMRDRAILLMLVTTGLRNKELRLLELQDIHWRTAEVLVRRTEGKCDPVVPFLDEAGAALADYVLYARPKIASPQVCIFKSYDDIVDHCCHAWNKHRRSALENHVHWHARLGLWVVITESWYQPGEQQADVVPGPHEDGVDGLAAGAGEAISFEQAVAFRMADDGFAGGAAAKLALDGGRSLPRALRNVDFRRGDGVSEIGETGSNGGLSKPKRPLE